MLGCGAGSLAAGFPNAAHTEQDLAAESPAPLSGSYAVTRKTSTSVIHLREAFSRSRRQHWFILSLRAFRF